MTQSEKTQEKAAEILSKMTNQDALDSINAIVETVPMKKLDSLVIAGSFDKLQRLIAPKPKDSKK